MMRPPHNSYGFTILEVMIAMAIFAIGILGIVKLQVSSTFSNTSSRTMSEATGAIAGTIEQLVLNTPYDDIKDIPENEEDEPIVFKSGPGVDYNISRTVNEIQLNPPNNTYNVKKITTTVEWSDKGEKKTFLVTTYKSLTADKGKSE